MTKSKKTRLTEDQKAFVVRELACFSSPKQVSAALMEEYGVLLAPQNVECYSPGKRAAQHLGAKWRELFDQCRKAFLAHMEDSVPEAHKAVRVKKLARAARAYETSRNYIAMADMLERIARECGNSFTNRHELTGKDGRSLQFEDVNAMSPDQVRDELRAHLQDPAMRTFVAGLMGADAAPIPAREQKHPNDAQGSG